MSQKIGTSWVMPMSSTQQHTSKKRGQFFTNRLVIDFMVEALDPDYQDTILDPAGGSRWISDRGDAVRP